MKGGHTFTPRKTQRYESTLQLAAAEAMVGHPLFDGPVAVDMTVYVLPPKSWSDKRRAAAFAGSVIPITRPDIDNYIKIAFDAFNGVVYGDDNQVSDLLCRKRYAEKPGMLVTVSAV